METVCRRQKTMPSKISGKRVKTAPGGKRNESHRLLQLILSLLLFLTVYIGRSAFPERVEEWSTFVGKEVSISQTIQGIRAICSSPASLMKESLKALMGIKLNPNEQSRPDTETAEPDPTVSVVPISATGRYGLDKAKEYGITKYMPGPKASDREVGEVSVSQAPEVVTAVAQAQMSDGTALPSNVSLQYYELGLDETVAPVFGEVTSGFGYRKSPFSGKREFHLALDIAADKGTEIAAFAGGKVRYIGESDEFGLYLMIDHANGVSTFYAHCSKLMVKKGDTVVCGQTVALVGDTGRATGPHLHLTILKDNIRLDPAYYVSP